MKKKLLFASALALLTAGIAFNSDNTVSAKSPRLSSLNIRNILDEYSSSWDAGTYNSQLRYWMQKAWTNKDLTADDIREELGKASDEYEDEY